MTGFLRSSVSWVKQDKKKKDWHSPFACRGKQRFGTIILRVCETPPPRPLQSPSLMETCKFLAAQIAQSGVGRDASGAPMLCLILALLHSPGLRGHLPGGSQLHLEPGSPGEGPLQRSQVSSWPARPQGEGQSRTAAGVRARVQILGRQVGTSHRTRPPASVLLSGEWVTRLPAQC